MKMKHKYIVSAFVLLGLCACQKEGVDTPISSDDGIEAQKIILRTMLAGRDTRWTEEDLAIPQENAGWKDISVDISSSKMETGNVVVSFWKFFCNNKTQTMLIYNMILDGYLVEVEIGDVQDNIEPNVYDVGRNIVNSLRIIK